MKRNRSWSFAIAALLGAIALAVAACGPPPAEPQQPDSHAAAGPPSAAPTASAQPTAPPTASPVASNGPEPPSSSAPQGPLQECRLPAPLKSSDACKADADCAPSDPCHARACVAKAKANPPTPTTACTRLMDCSSVDANPCLCFEGACALVPRKG